MKNLSRIRTFLLLIIFVLSSLFIYNTQSFNSDLDVNIHEKNDNNYSFMLSSNLDNEWPMFKCDRNNSGYNPYALNDNPGELRWKVNVPGEVVSSSPSIINGLIYIGTCDFQSNPTKGLYCIYPNGTIKWIVKTNGHVHSTPIADKNGNLIFTCWDGYLYSIFPNGTFNWRYKTGRYIYGSPTLGYDNNIYFGSHDTYFYSVSDNGDLNWKIQLEGETSTTPAIDKDGVIYVGVTNDHDAINVYAIYPNGTIKWRFITGKQVYGSPCLGEDGIIYFGSADGYLYSIHSNGTLNWKFQTGDQVASSPSIDKDGIIYVGSNDKNMYSIYPNGTQKWKYSTGDQNDGAPVIDGNGVVYFGSVDSYVYALNNDGSLKWKHKTSNRIRSTPSIDNNGNIYIGSTSGYLYSFGFPMPNPPINVQRRSGFRFINISWDDPENFDESEVMGYRVYRYNSDGSMNMVADLGKDIHFYNDTSLINGNNYSHSLVAYNRDGDGKDFYFPPIAPLSRSLEPRNLTIYPGPNLINLTWDPPVDSGGYPIIHYNIYRATGSVFTLVEKSNETFYSDTSLNVNIKYHYKVSAVTDYGEGKMSDIVSGISFVVPSTPRNFTLSTDNGYVDITWDAPAYDGGKPIIHYQLYRNGSEYRKLDPDTLFYRDEYVVTGIKYSYQLSAFNIIGEGWKTENATIFPLGVPGAPIGLTAELIPVGVNLTWDAPFKDGGATVNNYSIYRSTGDTYELIDISENLQYIDGQIDRGQSYFYYVTSTNAIGEGPGSDEVEIIIPQIELPGTPLNVHIELKGNGVKISWERPENYMDSNLEGYYIYRRIEEYYEVERIATLGETSYTDGVVQANYTYHYSVSAYNQYGESNRSDPVSIQIPSGTIIGNEVDSGDDGISIILIMIIIIVIVIILLSLIGILVFFLVKPTKKKEEVTHNNKEIITQQSYSETLESLFKDQKEISPTNEGESNKIIPGENEMI